MKRIFYFATAAFAACAMLVSCDKDDDKKPNNPPTPDPDQPTKLATPSVTCEVGETEVTVSWEAVANAASYEYTVDGGTATTTEETTFTLAVADLAAGNHTVSVTALPEDGSEEYTKSSPGTATFNIQEEQPDIDFSEWIGTYTATAEKGILVGSDGEYVVYSETTAPEPFEITISESELNDGTQVAVIEGLSVLKFTDGTSPIAVAMMQQDGSLSLSFEVSVGTVNANANGSTLELNLLWYPIVLVEGGNEDGSDYYGPSYITEATYVLKNVDGTITLSGNSGETQGYPYTVLGAEAYGVDAQGNGPYVFNEAGSVHPAGTITLIKKGSSAPTTLFNSSMRFSANATLFQPFSMVK